MDEWPASRTLLILEGNMNSTKAYFSDYLGAISASEYETNVYAGIGGHFDTYPPKITGMTLKSVLRCYIGSFRIITN